MGVIETWDTEAVTIPYSYYKNISGGQEWSTRWDNLLRPACAASNMRVTSLRFLYAPLWLLLPWISCMLISQASRPRWSQTNHLESPTSWFSKTTSWNTCWHTWPLIKLQKLLLIFLYQGYISIFRVPVRLLSDRGASFTSSVIQEMCKILGIKWLRTMPYHPQTNGLVERLHQTIICIIGKLGEDEKADWPSHLAEIAHAYNATHSTVTGYSPHYLMFRHRPRLPVNLFFPTIGSNEAPMREASTKHVDEYVASIQDRLRTALWEVQAQSTVEACRQKQYYDRKIGAVNLKPDDLVLMKADAFKGRRKIKDRWEEDTWEVVHQITTDIPSYKVMNQNGKSWVLHWNWPLLIASEVGIPLCIGICHAQDRCTSPTQCKTTSTRGERKITLQENNGKAVTQWPTSKAFLGWINRNYDFCHGCPPEHPQKRGGKTLGKVMWPWTLEGTCTWGRGNDIKAHWCLWIVNPKSIWPITKLGHGWQGQTKRVEWNR